MGNAGCRNAEVILALGTRFDDRATSAWLPGFTYSIPPSKLIHVDIDAAEIGRNFRPEVGIIADAKLFLQQLLATKSGDVNGDRSAWLGKIAGWRKRWEAETVPPRASNAIPIRPERAVAELRKTMPADWFALADVGIHHNPLVSDSVAWSPP